MAQGTSQETRLGRSSQLQGMNDSRNVQYRDLLTVKQLRNRLTEMQTRAHVPAFHPWTAADPGEFLANSFHQTSLTIDGEFYPSSSDFEDSQVMYRLMVQGQNRLFHSLSITSP